MPYHSLLHQLFHIVDHILQIHTAAPVQQIQVDSVKFDLSVYPYEVQTYSSLYILRESVIAKYDYRTACEVVDVERSMTNPHGLLIQKFRETANNLVETRKRK